MIRNNKSGLLLLEGYVYTNLHIAVSAGVFLSGGFRLFDLMLDWHMILLISAATFSAYALHRIIGSWVYKVDQEIPRFQYLHKYRKLFYTLIGLATSISLGCLISLNSQKIYWLLPMAFVTALYIVPINGIRWLREFSYIKIFLLSTVWAYVFVLPVLSSELNTTVEWYVISMVFAEKFLFVLALCIPFDIRDQKHDDQAGLKTLATAFSQNGTDRLIHGCTVICLCLVFLLYTLDLYDGLLSGFLVLFYIVLNRATIRSRGKKDLYFQGFLDGLILLQGFIHFL